MVWDGWSDVQSDVERLRGRRVLVLGDAMVDEYLRGEAERLSPEAPVPVLRVAGVRRVLGGAANTAANIVSLGGHATLICLAAADEAGATLQQLCAQAGVTCIRVDGGVPTLRKTRVIGQQQQIVRLDYEGTMPVESSVEETVRAAVNRHLADADIVVVSDYAKGFVSPGLMHHVIGQAQSVGRAVVVDPRPQHRDFYVGCDYITPNWREARALLGWPEIGPSAEAVAATAHALAETFDTNVVLTLGPHGIYYCSRDRDEEFSIPTLAREVYDVSGAGDTVVAAFALARAGGLASRKATTIANRAASIVVSKFGTATVTAEEMVTGPADRRLLKRIDLAPLAANLRDKRRRIVTVNGSFDVLHRGHLHILREARRTGDVLIVGVNSDASVRRYKGPERPIVPQADRAEMLLALRMVDYVHIFDEADPRAFLREIRPDVHVNGAEYGQNCIEADVVKQGGGFLHLVPRLPELSTTNLIEALRRAPAAAVNGESSGEPL